MKILLKNILEKLVLTVLFLGIIFGNILLIYNIKNKFININQKFDIINTIDNAKYVSVKDVENDSTIVIDNNEKKEKLKNIFNKMNIRKSKLNMMAKNKKIEYTVFIVDSQGKEFYISFANKEIMIYEEIYESDFNAKTYFEDSFK